MTEATSTNATLPELLTLKGLAEYLDVPASTIHYWRHRGVGPPGFRVGKRLRFRVTDVDVWLQEQADRAGISS